MPGQLAIAKPEFEAMLLDGTACRSMSSWSSEIHIGPKSAESLGHSRPLSRLSQPNSLPSTGYIKYLHYHFSLFKNPFMSFDMRNATQMFCFMDSILRGLDFCFAYLEDIFMLFQSLKEHKHHLWALFN
jgi:hypothetical protein